MQIDKVTITGADDSTDVQWMLSMQERFPFVEWGSLSFQKPNGTLSVPVA